MRALEYIVGIDEVGRGPIAGPVTIGAVVIQADDRFRDDWNQILDSKTLTAKARERWFTDIQGWQDAGLVRATTASCTARQIEDRGISWCLREAVSRVLRQIAIAPNEALVLLDGGLHAPAQFDNQETIVKGDQCEPVIGLASIVAKVTRDRYMVEVHKKFPKYRFDSHKGYGTKAHYEALRQHGLCELHRTSWIKPEKLG